MSHEMIYSPAVELNGNEGHVAFLFNGLSTIHCLAGILVHDQTQHLFEQTAVFIADAAQTARRDSEKRTTSISQPRKRERSVDHEGSTKLTPLLHLLCLSQRQTIVKLNRGLLPGISQQLGYPFSFRI